MLTVTPAARFRWWEGIVAGADAPHLEDLLDRPEWHRRAACRGLGTELFFPEMGGSAEPARAICAGCSVVAECRAAGAGDGGGFGIWAAESASERQRANRTRPGSAA